MNGLGERAGNAPFRITSYNVCYTKLLRHQMMASRYFKFKQSRSVVTSGGLGTMGFGLPAALGAQLGRPDRPVCLFVGDGGFQMTIQELGTIWQSKAPVKIILLNNNFLGMVRQWQELFFVITSYSIHYTKLYDIIPYRLKRQ